MACIVCLDNYGLSAVVIELPLQAPLTASREASAGDNGNASGLDPASRRVLKFGEEACV